MKEQSELSPSEGGFAVIYVNQCYSEYRDPFIALLNKD